MPTIDIISIINTFATAITALATWKAFRMAYKAYRQSHELKRITSFDSLFAQLMSNQLSLFGNNLSKTRVNNRFEAWLSDIKKDEDVFTNFFHFFDIIQGGSAACILYLRAVLMNIYGKGFKDR